RHTRWPRDWSSDVCSSDLGELILRGGLHGQADPREREERVEQTAEEDRAHDDREVFVADRDPGDPCRARTERGRQRIDLRAPGRSEERRVGKECRSGWSRM